MADKARKIHNSVKKLEKKALIRVRREKARATDDFARLKGHETILVLLIRAATQQKAHNGSSQGEDGTVEGLTQDLNFIRRRIAATVEDLHWLHTRQVEVEEWGDAVSRRGNFCKRGFALEGSRSG